MESRSIFHCIVRFLLEYYVIKTLSALSNNVTLNPVLFLYENAKWLQLGPKLYPFAGFNNLARTIPLKGQCHTIFNPIFSRYSSPHFHLLKYCRKLCLFRANIRIFGWCHWLHGEAMFFFCYLFNRFFNLHEEAVFTNLSELFSFWFSFAESDAVVHWQCGALLNHDLLQL